MVDVNLVSVTVPFVVVVQVLVLSSLLYVGSLSIAPLVLVLEEAFAGVSQLPLLFVLSWRRLLYEDQLGLLDR